MRSALTLGAIALACGLATASEAQQRPQAGQSAASQVTLRYEREIFVYPGASRRDPFSPLTSDAEGGGPRFEELRLQGIMFSPGVGQSMALLVDSGGRVYQVRVGQMVGNARVIEIGQTRVVLAVQNFGAVRQEILEIRDREGRGAER